ncbi:MAG: pyridoxal phosphate-dependent aminotransferase [Clostridia bacterium]|nr:pyridoxal phosphate-dependent aminotransferase [Clostridia bacterium]
MKYDFESIIDRDPAVRGTGKYRIMKDSKGNKPPKGIVPLSVADMEFKTAPCVIDAIKAEADFGVLGYHRLTDDFRAACCGWMKERHGWEVQPDWLIPLEQVVPALYNCLWAYTEPGDGIIVQTPAYHHFIGATEHTGRKVLENQLLNKDGRYEIDFDDLAEKAKHAKAMFLCSPQNPTGRVFTREELQRIGDICLENNVLVISDEIHHDLVQKEYRHIVYADLGEKYAQNCVICTSLSKTFNLAGLCYATIIIPNAELRAKFQKQMGLQAFMHISRFGPVAHEAAYRRGAEWLDELIEVIRGNFEYTRAFFAEKLPGIKVTELEGTYLVWCDFTCFGMSDGEMKNFLTDECMLYLDNGTEFGEAGSGFQRINVACPRKTLADALDRLYEGFKKRGLAK